jgi:HPt (histidine-containing phosphotransfer) domain-containing protein
MRDQHRQATGLEATGFDLPGLIERSGHDLELVREVLALFEPAAGRACDRIRLAIACGRFEEAGEALHSLAGTLGNVGAPDASALARLVRRRITEGRMDETTALWSRLERDLEHITGDVLGALRQLNASSEVDS